MARVENRKRYSNLTHLLIILVVLVIFFLASRMGCSAQSYWQVNLSLENNGQNIQTNYQLSSPWGAGEPRLRFENDILQIDGTDWYQVDFTAKTLEYIPWFRLGLGGYQEDKIKNQNYNPESDMYLIFGYDGGDNRKVGIDGEIKIFITDLSIGWKIDRASYLLTNNELSLGLSGTWENDKYIDRYGVGPIASYQTDDLSLSFEYFTGDINWRLGGQYNF